MSDRPEDTKQNPPSQRQQSDWPPDYSDIVDDAGRDDAARPLPHKDDEIGDPLPRAR